MKDIISAKIQLIKEEGILSVSELQSAYNTYLQQDCTILSIGPNLVHFSVTTNEEEFELSLKIEEENVFPYLRKKQIDWDVLTVAALHQLEEKLKYLDPKDFAGRQYTREGMVKRVMEERRKKADKAEYQIEFADNIYGEHILINEKGRTYKITLRDFENETGYIDSVDLRTNKLGTTKHIMFAFEALKQDKKLFKKLDKTYPFVEIYLDPLQDYQIAWHFPHEMDFDTDILVKGFFGDKKHYPKSKTKDFLRFINRAEKFDNIVIRPEVLEKVERVYNEETLEEIKKNTTLDYSPIKATLFDYQKEGVEFATFKEGVIIADEMGLGKTLQAITTAIFKKEIFGFKRTLIICPASLKGQWKSEIEKFTDETATIIEGLPKDRAELYKTTTDLFLILNYETILRDVHEINKYETDFIILDEAQRIKNYHTKTAQSLKSLKRKHALVITGTPIENKLIDLYSIVQFIDPYFLAPLWEFSYQHCFFDEYSSERITGYYNLNDLKERMQTILLRREKRNVIKQLPSVQQITVPVNMHPRQEEYHASFANGIARILSKKFRTAYDMQRLMLLLTNMRMVCNSTNLIDKETNFSPKLVELKYILSEKLALQQNKRKVIIFSEWIRSHALIAEVLQEMGLSYVELSGKVPVKKRAKLIEHFENNEDCRIFLSTEAGGSGLNLQMADTVINFELPWNPAKKNQRIGRIDRLGQKNTRLTVLNLITKGSIETKIATGLVLKQNLFEGVLDKDNTLDSVDFSEKGRSQFLRQIEEMVEEYEHPTLAETENLEGVPNESGDVLTTTEEDTEGETETTSNQTQAVNNSRATNSAGTQTPQAKMEEMQQVMNKGMDFLAGLYKMSTGQDMGMENKKIEIDKETGEVVMRFKLNI